MDQKITEQEFLEFIGSILERPKLYTPTASFYEVVSYLEGYGGNRVITDIGSHSPFLPFLSWLADKDSRPRSALKWQQFRDGFSSDEEALKNFHSRYKEYVKR